MTATTALKTKEQVAADDDAAEAARVAEMSDAEVLIATGQGRFGPAIVGKHLSARSIKLVQATGNGVFGPAITDPDFAAKEAAKRAANAVTDSEPVEVDDDLDLDDVNDDTGAGAGGTARDPMDLDDPTNPWHYVTLSGAKALAQRAQISYSVKPPVKRKDLIATLQAAKVVPPPVPSEKDLTDADDG